MLLTVFGGWKPRICGVILRGVGVCGQCGEHRQRKASSLAERQHHGHNKRGYDGGGMAEAVVGGGGRARVNNGIYTTEFRIFCAAKWDLTGINGWGGVERPQQAKVTLFV